MAKKRKFKFIRLPLTFGLCAATFLSFQMVASANTVDNVSVIAEEVSVIDEIELISAEEDEFSLSNDENSLVFEDSAHRLYDDRTYKVVLNEGESSVDRMKTYYDREFYEWSGIPNDEMNLRRQNKTIFRVLTDGSVPEIVSSPNFNPDNLKLRKRLGLLDDDRFYHQVLVNGYYNTGYYSGLNFIRPKTVSEAFELRGEIDEDLMRMMEGEYLRSLNAYEYFNSRQSLSDQDYSFWLQIKTNYESLKNRYLSLNSDDVHVGFIVDDDARISQEDLTYLKNAVDRLPKEWSRRLGAVHITGERFNRVFRLNGILGSTTSDNVIRLNGDYRSLVATLYHEASHVLDFQSMFFSEKHQSLRSISRLASFSTPYKYFIQNPKYGFTNYYKNNVAEAFAQVLSNFYVDSNFTDDELKRFGTVDFKRNDLKSTKLNHYANWFVNMFKSRYLKNK